MITRLIGRNKFGIANFLMQEIKKNGGENSPPKDYSFSEIHANIAVFLMAMTKAELFCKSLFLIIRKMMRDNKNNTAG